MKNIKILSLLTLLSFGQMYVNANPDLSFVLTFQAIDELDKSISSDNDDIGALNFLKTMEDSINFDIKQQKALNGAKNTYLYNGVPLDLKEIAEDNKDLKDRIKTLDNNISEFKKGGVLPHERKKYNNRLEERRQAKTKLDANIDAIEANKDAMTHAQQAQAKIATLRAKNSLVIEQAIESYIISFGRAYIKPGTSTIVISSKYNENLPITPKEYQQLVATLSKAAKQFGSTIMIDLPLENLAPMTISEVIKCINNMPLTASNASWAMFGLKASLGIAAAIAAGGIAYNLYQDKAWNDTSDAQALFDAAYQAYAENVLPGAQAMSQEAWAQANGLYENASQFANQTNQDVNDWYAANFGA